MVSSVLVESCAICSASPVRAQVTASLTILCVCCLTVTGVDFADFISSTFFKVCISNAQSSEPLVNKSTWSQHLPRSRLVSSPFFSILRSSGYNSNNVTSLSSCIFPSTYQMVYLVSSPRRQSVACKRLMCESKQVFKEINWSPSTGPNKPCSQSSS